MSDENTFGKILLVGVVILAVLVPALIGDFATSVGRVSMLKENGSKNEYIVVDLKKGISVSGRGMAVHTHDYLTVNVAEVGQLSVPANIFKVGDEIIQLKSPNGAHTITVPKKIMENDSDAFGLLFYEYGLILTLALILFSIYFGYRIIRLPIVSFSHLIDSYYARTRELRYSSINQSSVLFRRPIILMELLIDFIFILTPFLVFLLLSYALFMWMSAHIDTAYFSVAYWFIGATILIYFTPLPEYIIEWFLGLRLLGNASIIIVYILKLFFVYEGFMLVLNIIASFGDIHDKNYDSLLDLLKGVLSIL